jgi:hypothetical protein
MKRIILVVIACVVMTSCTPIEKQAYNTIVGAKAFLDHVRALHPECSSQPTATVCADITKATSAKDALIDATEVYCSGAQFESGGACQPPAKGTAAFTPAQDKLKAAMALYNQAATDLKGVM